MDVSKVNLCLEQWAAEAYKRCSNLPSILASGKLVLQISSLYCKVNLDKLVAASEFTSLQVQGCKPFMSHLARSKSFLFSYRVVNKNCHPFELKLISFGVLRQNYCSSYAGSSVIYF